MTLINPFEELIVFGKLLPLEPVSSTRLVALVPSGRHVAHGQDLEHYTGVKGAGGRALKLQRYTGVKGAGGNKVGLEHFTGAKGAGGSKVGLDHFTGVKGAGGKKVGLERVSGVKGAGGRANKLERYSKADEQNSKIPAAARRGKRL